MKKKIERHWSVLFLVVVLGSVYCSSSVLAQPPKVEKKQEAEKKTPEKKEGKPDLQFEQKTYDFGTVYKGASVVHKFKFTNKGDAVLNIGKVKTSCGCTAALTSSKTINPGESGEIETTFRSKNFRGRITKKIYVNSNDPDENKIQLVIKGVVLDEVTLEPQRIQFNMVEKGAEHSKAFHVKQMGEKPLKILDIKSNLDFLSAKVESADKIFDVKKGEKLDYEVLVTLAKNAPPGKFNGVLTIKTNLNNIPDIKYYVVGMVKEDN
jgi:hypothetical protein